MQSASIVRRTFFSRPFARDDIPAGEDSECAAGDNVAEPVLIIRDPRDARDGCHCEQKARRHRMTDAIGEYRRHNTCAGRMRRRKRIPFFLPPCRHKRPGIAPGEGPVPSDGNSDNESSGARQDESFGQHPARQPDTIIVSEQSHRIDGGAEDLCIHHRSVVPANR